MMAPAPGPSSSGNSESALFVVLASKATVVVNPDGKTGALTLNGVNSQVTWCGASLHSVQGVVSRNECCSSVVMLERHEALPVALHSGLMHQAPHRAGNPAPAQYPAWLAVRLMSLLRLYRFDDKPSRRGGQLDASTFFGPTFLQNGKHAVCMPCCAEYPPANSGK